MLKRFTFLILFTIFLQPLYAADKWPRTIESPPYTVTLYQPQLESFAQNSLKGRLALSYKKNTTDPPQFGVVWFTAQTSINRDTGVVLFPTITINDTRFADKEKNSEALKDKIQEIVNTTNLQTTLDTLTTSLAALDIKTAESKNLKNTPPTIIYREKPALLIYIDGKTILKKIADSSMENVVNSPYPIFFDPTTKTWHLTAATATWYKAKSVDGPWQLDATPPSELVQIINTKKSQSKQQSPATASETSSTISPEIIVCHQPTELIVSDGAPQFTPVTDDILAITNSISSVFLELTSQNYFVVISGRWYLAPSMGGPWKYVAANKLPNSFAAIPSDSKYGKVLAFVAGTPQAKEAVMDAQIPQTATVKRGIVAITVHYDGTPKFQVITGTSLQFAVNASESVIRSGGEYYLIKDAVWYLSSSPNGPWRVSDHVPPGIAGIPPSSPLYNTKFVYVYDATPDVVYVGYTPGYVGSYVYGPTIVYGTGWYYTPWISPYFYYPRPATWGFCVSYNSWSGWGVGISWSSGPFHVGFYSGGGYAGWTNGWWGAGGYRYNNVNINNNININNSNINSNNRWHNGNNLYHNNRQRANIRSDFRNSGITGNNLRNIDGSTRARGEIQANEIRDKANKVNQQNLASKSRGYQTSLQKNNIFAGDKGQIYRQNNNQWQERVGQNWQNSKNFTNQGHGYNRPSSLERDNFSRERNYQRNFENRPHNSPSSFSRGGLQRAGRLR